MLLGMALNCDQPIELMKIAIGLINKHSPTQWFKLSRWNIQLLMKNKLGFQIGLTIQIRSFNIAERILLAGVQQQKISRYRFIVFNFDNVPSAELHPLYCYKLPID